MDDLDKTISYRLSGGLGTLYGKGNGKIVIVSYTTLNHTLKIGKVPTTAVGNTRSN